LKLLAKKSIIGVGREPVVGVSEMLNLVDLIDEFCFFRQKFAISLHFGLAKNHQRVVREKANWLR
jgi:hypothetical protein